eukprot:15484168-Alexandrium_andersonii.AAC.1
MFTTCRCGMRPNMRPTPHDRCTRQACDPHHMMQCNDLPIEAGLPDRPPSITPPSTHNTRC